MRQKTHAVQLRFRPWRREPIQTDNLTQRRRDPNGRGRYFRSWGI